MHENQKDMPSNFCKKGFNFKCKNQAPKENQNID